jgi:hypothetical protein
MRFQVALLGFDADHDRLLRFHLAHTRGQAHEFNALGGSHPSAADIAVIDLDAPEAAATLGALRATPTAIPRIDVSTDGQRGSSVFRLARPDALASLPRQLQRVVDTSILAPSDTPSIADLDSPDPTVRLLASAARRDRAGNRAFRALVIDADAALRSATSTPTPRRWNRRCAAGTTTCCCSTPARTAATATRSAAACAATRRSCCRRW